jgi:hypothetical protein
MKAFGRCNEESRNAGSLPAHCLISVCLDSESLIARPSFGPSSPSFHIREIRGSPSNVCLNLRKSAQSVDDYIRVLCGEK